MPRLQTDQDDGATTMKKAPDDVLPDEPMGKGEAGFAIRAPQKSGRTKVTSVTVDGKLPLEAARRVVLTNLARLDVCYGQRLVVKPALGGTGGMLIVVDPNGGVLDAKTQAPDKELGDCLSKAVRPWQFPQVGAGLARITVQLEFTAPAKAGVGSGSGSAPPPPPPDDAAKRPPTPPPPVKLLAQWTPFATTPAREIAGLADKARTAIEPKLGQIQLCTPATGEGTIRALVRIDPRGTVRGVRTGGFGDAKAETCVGAALMQLETGKPPSQYVDDVELACDFTVGAPAKQFRVTPAAGYTIWQPGTPLATKPETVLLVEAGATTTLEQLGPIFADTVAPAILVAVDGVLVASAGGTNEAALGKDVEAVVAVRPDGDARPCGGADLAQPFTWSIHGTPPATGAHLATLAGRLARLSRLTNQLAHCP